AASTSILLADAIGPPFLSSETCLRCPTPPHSTPAARRPADTLRSGVHSTPRRGSDAADHEGGRVGAMAGAPGWRLLEVPDSSSQHRASPGPPAMPQSVAVVPR